MWICAEMVGFEESARWIHTAVDSDCWENSADKVCKLIICLRFRNARNLCHSFCRRRLHWIRGWTTELLVAQIIAWIIGDLGSHPIYQYSDGMCVQCVPREERHTRLLVGYVIWLHLTDSPYVTLYSSMRTTNKLAYRPIYSICLKTAMFVIVVYKLFQTSQSFYHLPLIARHWILAHWNFNDL